MKEKLFELAAEQLKEIAVALQKKVNIGLEKDGEELACIPTYICPKTDGIAGRSAQVNCEPGMPVQGDPIQKTAQQKITGPPGDQGLKRLDVKGKHPVENGAEGGRKQDHRQQDGKLARSTVVGDPPEKGG